ncbi:MAG: DUF1638 domain-containing protein [Candidatus Bathyarchaeota archaeon]
MKIKPYLICCSALKDEIEKLSLIEDYNIVFLGMTLHSDCDHLEQKLRKVITKCAEKSFSKVTLVYGDYCLGPNDKMKKLARKYNARKVDALNCIDCLLGGNGNYLKLDPESKMIFLSPGWIKYFDYYLKSTSKEAQEFFISLFGGLEGIILLDTLGNLKDYEDKIKNFVDITGLEILKTTKIDTRNLKNLIMRALKPKECTL